MCTALFYGAGEGFFGRTLDLEHGYGEAVTLTPRGCPLPLRGMATLTLHYAILGMAAVVEGFPLYYDGINETGLCGAALRFPVSAVYPPPAEEKENLAVFELIPYLLGTCATVEQALARLEELHLCDIPFSPDYPTAPLHWMLADGKGCAVVECTAEGLQIYRNPVGVMTNEPPFPHQCSHLAQYAHLSAAEGDSLWQTPLSRGCGAMGLPGDFSSPSRFVREAFLLAHGVTEEEGTQITQFFHLLAGVEVPRGSLRLPDGRYVVSRYSCCMDRGGLVYYYRTYDCPRIQAVRLTEAEGDVPVRYPLPTYDYRGEIN